MDFKKINYKDKDCLEKLLSLSKTDSYEYSFTSLYIWRKLYNTDFSLIDNSLVIRKYFKDDFPYFMMPISNNYENLPIIINQLKHLSNNNKSLILCDIDDYFLSILKNNFNISYCYDKASFEYIYLTTDLINLSGNKYHKKKNHYNTFIKNYSCNIYTINNNKIIDDCLNLIDFSHQDKLNLSQELKLEKDAINDIIYKLDDLSLKSIAIYVGNTLAGFSIAEISNDTAIIHIERCNRNFKGIYSFINQKFLLDNFSKTTWVNRQEDCGDLGLRKSKLSYYPNHFIKKYKVVIL